MTAPIARFFFWFAVLSTFLSVALVVIGAHSGTWSYVALGVANTCINFAGALTFRRAAS